MQDHDNEDNHGFSRISYGTRPGVLPIEWETFKCRQWPGVRVQYRRLNGPLTYSFSISGKTHCFFLLDIHRMDGETIIGDLPKITIKDLRDKFVFAGESCSISGWSQIAKAGSFTMVELETIEGDDIWRIPPIFTQSEVLLRSLMSQFKSLVIDDASAVPGYAETLAMMLSQELKRIHATRDRIPAEDGGLTPRQLRTAIAYMEDRINQEISISDMAKNLGISPFHFIRMFKKSVGVPPHRYFLERRVDRAKELLRSSHLSVSEVAEMSGFGGVAQLTRTFRRIVGTIPSKFRKDLLEC